jgi:hypothetical protein
MSVFAIGLWHWEDKTTFKLLTPLPPTSMCVVPEANFNKYLINE